MDLVVCCFNKVENFIAGNSSMIKKQINTQIHLAIVTWLINIY